MKKKVIVIFTIIIIILLAIFIVYRNYIFDEYLKMNESIVYKKIEENFNNGIEAIIEMNEIFVYSISENSGIQEAFFNKDREKLIELTVPIYSKIEEKVLQAHFILPDYISFLRVHELNEYGDNNEYRDMLKEVNEKGIIISGIEEGKTGFSLRTLAPVYYKGEYAGTFECGLDIESVVLKYFKDQNDIDVFIYAIRVNDDEIIAKTIPDDSWKELSSKDIDAIKNRNTIVIKSKDENKVIIAAPIMNYKGKVIGYAKIIYDNILAYEKRMNIVLNNNIMIILVIICLLLIFIDYLSTKKRTEERNDNINNIINSITSLIEARDLVTGKHILKTQKYVKVIIEELKKVKNINYKTSAKLREEILAAAPLHDIGKIAIPDSILLKEGLLTEKERSIMQKHTVIGKENISFSVESERYSFIKTLEDIIYYHHERWDGKGYPEELYREDIPLCARIMALADSYDAITSHRVYQDARTHEEAVKIIKEEKGLQFDPVIVGLFLKNRHKFEKILDEDE